MIGFLGMCIIIASAPLWFIAGALAGINEKMSGTDEARKVFYGRDT